jgi:hypothetical protein
MNERNGEIEPRWRKCLQWGAVWTFFGMPVFVFALHLLSFEFEWIDLEKHRWEFSYLADFYHTNALLVFGLAGLNTVDRLSNGKMRKPT